MHALRAGRGAHCPSVFVCVAHLSLEMTALESRIYLFIRSAILFCHLAMTESLMQTTTNSEFCFQTPQRMAIGRAPNALLSAVRGLRIGVHLRAVLGLEP